MSSRRQSTRPSTRTGGPAARKTVSAPRRRAAGPSGRPVGATHQPGGTRGTRGTRKSQPRVTRPPTRPAGRLQRLRRGLRGQVRRRGRILALWLLLAGALVAGAGYLFFFSSVITVKDVQVTGVDGELSQSVQERAAIPAGRPLARVSEERVRSRVLEDTRVASVSVDRHWPDAVTVRATPREPALVVSQGSGTHHHVDLSGVVFEQVEAPEDDLPVVRTQVPVGELSQNTIHGLVELWYLRPDDEALGAELGTPSLRRNGEVRFGLDQVTVLWGSPTEAEKKWSVVSALLAQEAIDPQGALPLTIDVRAPDTPVVTGLPELFEG